MIRELLAHSDYVRVLSALERRPMRFGALQKELELHPPQIARALRFLTKSKMVELTAADTATGIYVPIYVLTDRGEAMTEVLMAFIIALNRRRSRLGDEYLSDIRAWRH
ncbi:MAG: hypothetical protein HYV14_15405 [Elusimicrobia bacterium]|nr:hypothetical protein [Elusimicrobiota bacterium]